MSTLSCPSCGYHLANRAEVKSPQSLTSFKSPVLVHEKEIPALQAEVHHLDSLILHLNDKRAAILRKLNETQTTTRRLPTEILSTIFRFVRPPTSFDTLYLEFYVGANAINVEESFHHNLAAVCHLWNQVVQSTPQLWTTITLRADRRSSITKITSLLDLYFKRSRNLPLSILLDFQSEAKLRSEMDALMPFEARQAYLSQLQPLSAAVFDQDRAARIRQLILIHPPVELFSYIDKGLSKCDSMTIFQSREEIQTDHTLELLELPCLRRLDLIDVNFRVSQLPNTTTTLHLRNMLFTFGSETLMGLRNLVIFEIINPRGRAESILQITESITLPNVEHFGWCSPETDMALFSDFFHYIRFPRLRSLFWGQRKLWTGTTSDEDHKRLSVNFFSNLPPTLSSLAFSILDPSNETTTLIHHILHSIPQVSGLQFIQCPTVAIEAALEVVGRPLPSSTLVYDELHEELAATGAFSAFGEEISRISALKIGEWKIESSRTPRSQAVRSEQGMRSGNPGSVP
ncbi:hypothetical protein AGABI1DRAFT_92455 [Agaricus bisporus var. burnettii JB137-S8]|uniref:F-box domain-containing protein n=1 Tax=Agaricus bisporus var. burnettii (strain JB137-S8 / ATCC MYA-4627 / FGSC 10392) TaxID=597362 RepID=K5X6T2_AGABU|nr:uncharacterized protein AGABI1DRAFT_92455 [Agaricus bisporus var. burnettii JB137-S8]EKM78928.1 hypothetical protein AGABI1DRAFT_92455 [Agaricus bisporus var. burnettii JB137-S8]